jgi:outer membrane protein assembly factor BamB
MKERLMKRTMTVALVSLLISAVLLAGRLWAHTPTEILRTSGVKGGLVVVLGCDDPELLVALRVNERYIVQGLDADAAKVDAARKYLFEKGSYGPVSVAPFDGEGLPYADNLVNLVVVASDKWHVAREELLRVLVPGGVSIATRHTGPPKPLGEDGSPLANLVKPQDLRLDEWTHSWGDATGNAVSKDTMVAPPKRLQWLGGGPLWPRCHDWTPSLSSMVSADGRVIYIYDYSPSGIAEDIRNRFFLICRDAYNGVLLWKKEMIRWDSRDLTGLDGHKAGGRWGFPPHISKRVVAVGDHVYVTLGLLEPVSVLDAATGELVRTLKETERTDEILCADGTLYLSRNLNAPDANDAQAKEVMAVDPESGFILWRKTRFRGIASGLKSDPQGRLELTVGDQRVFLATDQHVIALDRKTGNEAWRFKRPERNLLRRSKPNYETLVYADGVVLFAQQERRYSSTYYMVPTYLYALDAKTGRKLWDYKIGVWGTNVPTELFVIDGLVWGHRYREAELGSGYGMQARKPATSDKKAFLPVEHSDEYYVAAGLDLHTGEVVKKLSTWGLFKGESHHHRCWRNRATVSYLMMSWHGAEFIDLQTGETTKNRWARGGCLYGMMPANGLLYVPPNECNCFSEIKMFGFLALNGHDRFPKPFKSEHPLDKGPYFAESAKGKKVFGQVSGRESDKDHDRACDKDWATYRFDGTRKGSCDTAIPDELKPKWKTELPGKPGPMTMADGLLYTVLPDHYAVVALDGGTGEIVWIRVAAGRTPLPPTIHGGLALVGSDDGWLYAFDARSGELSWRLRAAPADNLVGDKDRLASAWPVHGSPLIFDGLVWVCAGRSTYLDHGIYVLGVEPATGKVVREIRLDSREQPPKWKTLEDAAHVLGPQITNYQEVVGNLGQILNSDGGAVYLRHRKLYGDQPPVSHRMIAASTFTDPTIFNRTGWIVDRLKTAGLLVFQDRMAWGVQTYRNTSRGGTYHIGEDSYALYAMQLGAKPSGELGWPDRGEPGSYPTLNGRIRKDLLWHRTMPLRATGLVHVDGKLLIAGAPDVLNPDDPLALFEGRTDARLLIWDDQNGEQLGEVELDAPPVWDGMIAVGGKVFVSQTNDKVVCFGD